MKWWTATAVRFRFRSGRNETRKIKDSHELGSVTVMKAFAESSNVAVYDSGGNVWSVRFFTIFYSGLGLDIGRGSICWERRAVFLRPANKWSLSSRISISIGYEMTATALQITSAMAAIANNGQYVKPRILKEVWSPQHELVRKVEPELGAACLFAANHQDHFGNDGAGRRKGYG